MELSPTPSPHTDYRPNWSEYFLDIAEAVSKRATCPRLQVGAVITYKNRIVTTGYNGAPPGEPHCTEVGCDIVNGHCLRTRHAESNALAQIDTCGYPGGYPLKMYITHEPCFKCRENAALYLIKDIVWEKGYGS